MKEANIEFETKEFGKKLWENASIHFSLEGWPCAVTFISLSFAYVMITRIKCDTQVKQLNNADMKRIEKVG